MVMTTGPVMRIGRCCLSAQRPRCATNYARTSGLSEDECKVAAHVAAAAQFDPGAMHMRVDLQTA
jgi:hypothetical protein